MRKKALIVGGKKEAVDYIRIALGIDFSVRFADSPQKAKTRRMIEFLLFPCDFQCSLADCGARFRLAHLCWGIRFAVVRFLPVNRHMLREPVFSLSFFESYDFTPSQREIVERLKASRLYSRVLISQFHPDHLLSKILMLQTEIVENPNEILNLKKSAEATGFSPCWLSRKFRQISGQVLKGLLSKTRLGIVFYQGGNIGEAIAHYYRAIEIDPEFAEAHNNLGVALQKQEKVEEAISHSEQA